MNGLPISKYEPVDPGGDGEPHKPIASMEHLELAQYQKVLSGLRNVGRPNYDRWDETVAEISKRYKGPDGSKMRAALNEAERLHLKSLTAAGPRKVSSAAGVKRYGLPKGTPLDGTHGAKEAAKPVASLKQSTPAAPAKAAKPSLPAKTPAAGSKGGAAQSFVSGKFQLYGEINTSAKGNDPERTTPKTSFADGSKPTVGMRVIDKKGAGGKVLETYQAYTSVEWDDGTKKTINNKNLNRGNAGKSADAPEAEGPDGMSVQGAGWALKAEKALPKGATQQRVIDWLAKESGGKADFKHAMEVVKYLKSKGFDLPHDKDQAAKADDDGKLPAYKNHPEHSDDTLLKTAEALAKTDPNSKEWPKLYAALEERGLTEKANKLIEAAKKPADLSGHDESKLRDLYKSAKSPEEKKSILDELTRRADGDSGDTKAAEAPATAKDLKKVADAAYDEFAKLQSSNMSNQDPKYIAAESKYKQAKQAEVKAKKAEADAAAEPHMHKTYKKLLDEAFEAKKHLDTFSWNDLHTEKPEYVEAKKNYDTLTHAAHLKKNQPDSATVAAQINQSIEDDKVDAPAVAKAIANGSYDMPYELFENALSEESWQAIKDELDKAHKAGTLPDPATFSKIQLKNVASSLTMFDHGGSAVDPKAYSGKIQALYKAAQNQESKAPEPKAKPVLPATPKAQPAKIWSFAGLKLADMKAVLKIETSKGADADQEMITALKQAMAKKSGK